MNRGPAALHRLTVGVFGLILLLVGGAAVAWQASIEPVVSWVDGLDATWASSLIAASWWWAVLLGIVVISLAWGLWLLSAATRPGRVDDLVLPGSDADGELIVAPKRIASAVAAELSGHTMFDSATVRAIDDRGRSLIRIEVCAPPRYSYDEVAVALGPTLDRVRGAVDGADIHIQALVHLQNPK